MTISSKLARALQTAPTLERDAAAVELAKMYAKTLDQLFVRLAEPEAAESPAHHRRVIAEIDSVGRRLEAMLDRLGMAPGARPSARVPGPEGGAAVDPASVELERLRSDAAGAGPAGVDYAAAVDPAVTAAHAGD